MPVRNSTIAVPVIGSTSIALTQVEVRDLGFMVVSGKQQRVRPSYSQYIMTVGERQVV